MPVTLYEANKKGIYKWRENNRVKYNEKHRTYRANYYAKYKELIREKRQKQKENEFLFQQECQIFRNILI